MTKIIKTLLNDHRIILSLLKKCKYSNLSNEERSAFVTTVKAVLREHFELEDNQIYPKLKELATDNNRALNTVEEFTTGLEKIGAIITNFFEQHEKDPDNIFNSSDFGKIIKLLEVRIQKEEKGLYPLYEQLVDE